MTSNEPRRPEGDAIHGSAPFDIPPARTDAVNVAFRPLTFDSDKFIQFVQNEGLTEDQAVALLRAYWDVFVAYVDVAFGMHPAQDAVDRFPKPTTKVSKRSPRMVSSRQAFSSNAKETKVRRQEGGRKERGDS